jgi:hypothetical protein
MLLDVSEELVVFIIYPEDAGNRLIPNVGKPIPHHTTVRFQVQEMCSVSQFTAVVVYITAVRALDIDTQDKFRKIAAGSLCVRADLHSRSL